MNMHVQKICIVMRAHEYRDTLCTLTRLDVMVLLPEDVTASPARTTCDGERRGGKVGERGEGIVVGEGEGDRGKGVRETRFETVKEMREKGEGDMVERVRKIEVGGSKKGIS